LLERAPLTEQPPLLSEDSASIVTGMTLVSRVELPMLLVLGVMVVPMAAGVWVIVPVAPVASAAGAGAAAGVVFGRPF